MAMATETINLMANIYHSRRVKGSGHALNKSMVIVKSTQRSHNSQLCTYGYSKYFCSVYYTSLPHFILLPFREIYPT